MKRFKLFWVVVLLACAACVSTGESIAQTPPPTRTITVTVTVEAPAGTPVEGVPVGLGLSQPPALGKTDAQGHATLTGTFPQDVIRIHAGVCQISTPITRMGSLAEIDRFNAVIGAHSFQGLYPLDVGTATSYSMTIVGQPSIEVSGRFQMASPGWARDFSVSYAGQPLTDFLFPLDGEQFTLKGVPKGSDVDLVFGVSNRQRVQIVHLSAQQTQSAVSLGDVVAPPDTAGRSVALTMLHAEGVGGTFQSPLPRSGEVALVRSDGQVVYLGSVIDGGVVQTQEHDDKKLKLPPGTYYCSPGVMLSGDMPSTRLYRLLKAGRVADVEAAHDPAVPKIVVPNDGAADPLVFSFDAVQAEAAIKGIP